MKDTWNLDWNVNTCRFILIDLFSFDNISTIYVSISNQLQSSIWGLQTSTWLLLKCLGKVWDVVKSSKRTPCCSVWTLFLFSSRKLVWLKGKRTINSVFSTNMLENTLKAFVTSRFSAICLLFPSSKGIELNSD